MKHIWKTCNNTGTVSCFVTNLSVLEGLCTLYALLECSGDILLCSFRLGSPPNLQSPFVDCLQCMVLNEDPSSNGFFVFSRACEELLHHQLLEKLPLKHVWKNLYQHWNCVLLCNQFICPGRLLYLVCIVGVQWRSSFLCSFRHGSYPILESPLLD